MQMTLNIRGIRKKILINKAKYPVAGTFKVSLIAEDIVSCEMDYWKQFTLKHKMFGELKCASL
jgi:hypothetical protein